MSDTVDWLLTMRSITGMSETPGTANNDKILAMADEIGRIFPEMVAYCDQYNSDAIPWCGLTVAYCMAKAGIRPPFVAGKDTDCFLWAKSWADDPNYDVLKAPRLGCVVILTRSGGGHVSLFESTSGNNYLLRGGNQSDAINVSAFPRSSVVAMVWPKDGPSPPPIDPPAEDMPVLRRGDTGAAVAHLQSLLPWVDGDFGSATESTVKTYQKSKGLEVDGIVGPDTWAALLDETPPPSPPSDVKFAATGSCSWFGGPDDKGVQPDEGLAFISSVSQAPELFLPQQPPGTTGLARRLDPAVFYIACRWDYKKTPREMLLSEEAWVRAPSTGIALKAYPADWGPNEKTGRVADISSGLMEALGIETDDEVEVIFPYEGTA